MALVAADLAQAIHDAMSFPGSVSSTMVDWADGIITEVKNALSNGTCTGIAPAAGGPLSSGASADGTITNISGSSMATLIATATYGGTSSSELQSFCDAIADHIKDDGLVVVDSGNVTGTCANTPASPGPFIGVGTSGYISGLSGSVLATLVKTNVGFPSVSSPLTQMCTALVDYLMTNTNIDYSSASGTAPAGGGAITGGVITGATFT